MRKRWGVLFMAACLALLAQSAFGQAVRSIKTTQTVQSMRRDADLLVIRIRNLKPAADGSDATNLETDLAISDYASRYGLRDFDGKKRLAVLFFIAPAVERYIVKSEGGHPERRADVIRAMQKSNGLSRLLGYIRAYQENRTMMVAAAPLASQ